MLSIAIVTPLGWSVGSSTLSAEKILAPFRDWPDLIDAGTAPSYCSYTGWIMY
jgi:hypothetical protein